MSHRKKVDYSDDFLAAWAIYPPRGEHPNPKKAAYQAWRSRLKEGLTVETLTACTQEYARYCKRAAKTGTESVMMAATFYGPNERWRDFLPAPKQGGDDSGLAEERRNNTAARQVAQPPEAERATVQASLRGLISTLAEAKKLR